MAAAEQSPAGTPSVLVTGGAGYIGSHVCKALAAAGFLPIAVDNLSNGHRHAVKWGPLEVCDLRDNARLTQIALDSNAVAALHFAAKIEVGEGQKHPLDFYENNIAGTLSLLKALEAAGIDALVFSSTCAVYGIADKPLTEAHPINPGSVYGRSKAMVESFLKDANAAHGLRFVSLRYFNAAGADPDGELGEEHDPESHLIPNALKAAAGLGKGLNIFGDDYPTPDGTCLRDYIHVTDLADAHVRALRFLLDGGDQLICNLGTGQPYSVLQVVKTIEAEVGLTVPHEIGPRRPGDVPMLTADVSHSREALGFAPRHSDLATIIRTAWAFHRKMWDVQAA